MRRAVHHAQALCEPLGWDNIEQFLKLGPRNTEGQKGAVSRETDQAEPCPD
jgi:hypothetical protein